MKDKDPLLERCTLKTQKIFKESSLVYTKYVWICEQTGTQETLQVTLPGWQGSQAPLRTSFRGKTQPQGALVPTSSCQRHLPEAQCFHEEQTSHSTSGILVPIPGTQEQVTWKHSAGSEMEGGPRKANERVLPESTGWVQPWWLLHRPGGSRAARSSHYQHYVGNVLQQPQEPTAEAFRWLGLNRWGWSG